MDNILEKKKIKDEDGNEHRIAFSVELKEKEVAVCLDKSVFVKNKDGFYEKCKKDDEISKILEKYLKEPKSLDVEYDNSEK